MVQSFRVDYRKLNAITVLILFLKWYPWSFCSKIMVFNFRLKEWLLAN